MATFEWNSEYRDVELQTNVDEWSGRELRAVERLTRGAGIGGSGFYGTYGLCIAISAARVVPGLTVEAADAELTFGRIRAIAVAITAQERAEQEAAETEAAAVEGDVVLSPTRPGEPGDQPADS